MSNVINESKMIMIGGVEQYVMVRGNDSDLPIILFLHGGPGSPMSSLASEFPKEIEDHFVTVHWDQRGAGKSYSEGIPIDSMTIEQFISDTLEVTDYLLEHYKREKIFLLGLSWGSLLGISVAHRHPEKYHAYIGMSQVINMEKGEEISYDFLLEEVKRTGQEEAEKELKMIGRPPYKSDEDLLIQRKWLIQLGYAERKINSAKMYTDNCTKEELEIISKGLEFTLPPLLNEILAFNAQTITKIDTPVYICMGRYDYQTPFILAKDYFETLESPYKEFFWFEESAHGTALEEPDRFVEILLTVLDQTLNK